MKPNPYKAYQQNSILTASPAELTLKLYDGCLMFIGQARTCIENGDVAGRNLKLQKAQNIIQEFITTIDRSSPVAKDYLPLYDFIYRQLVQANVSGKLEPLNVAEELVIEFRDLWKEVMAITRQSVASGQV
jgi:flagellar secretion chaperone FliS